MSFLPFPEHSLWVYSVQLPLSVFSTTFFCTIKYISCLQGILLEENISNSSSYIGIWADFDCPSTQNANFNHDRRDSFCFDHMLLKGLPMCSNTPFTTKQKITIYHSIIVWTKLVSLHAVGRPGHNHKVLLLPFQTLEEISKHSHLPSGMVWLNS